MITGAEVMKFSVTAGGSAKSSCVVMKNITTVMKTGGIREYWYCSDEIQRYSRGKREK